MGDEGDYGFTARADRGRDSGDDGNLGFGGGGCGGSGCSGHGGGGGGGGGADGGGGGDGMVGARMRSRRGLPPPHPRIPRPHVDFSADFERFRLAPTAERPVRGPAGPLSGRPGPGGPRGLPLAARDHTFPKLRLIRKHLGGGCAPGSAAAAGAPRGRIGVV